MLINYFEYYIMTLEVINIWRYAMEKEILSMEEAAELFNVSIKTFIKLLKEEKVPARKIGREWRFSRRALIDWLSSGDSQAYSSSESDTKEFFNRIAPDWEDLRKGYYDESVVNRLVGMELFKTNMTILDLGAGNGYLSRAVAGHVGKVIAVDISSEMLRELRKKADMEGISNIEAVESDGCDMPLEDSCIDVVCSNMYLHHIEDPEVAIKEMHRVLKPGGAVFLADLKEHSDKELKEKMYDVWQGFDTGDITEWFRKCGFKKIVFHNMSDKKGSRNKTENPLFIMTAIKE